MNSGQGFLTLKRGTKNVDELNQSEFDSTWQNNANELLNQLHDASDHDASDQICPSPKAMNVPAKV